MSRIKSAATSILVALFVVSVASCGGGSDPSYQVPTSPVTRTDINYGYYATFGNQYNETKDHTNVYWEAQFLPREQIISNLQQHTGYTVLDVAGQVYQLVPPSTYKREFNPAAESNLRELFDSLRAAGVLSEISILVPIDEPDLNLVDIDSNLTRGVQAIKNVTATYPELSGVKLGVIYSNVGFHQTQLFDVLGMDYYGGGSGILAPGSYYDRLNSMLTANQKLWLIPGGSYGQDPTPFENYANSNPRVWAIIPFLWASTQSGSEALLGIRDQELMREKYVALGKRLLNRP